MLHGAVNMSNYGDYIFAELFYQSLLNNGVQVEFYTHPKYGISSYFQKHLDYKPETRNYKKLLHQCDAFIFFSGGYIAEPRKKGFLAETRHIHRYLYPASLFMKAGKPIYVMGVGAGPFDENAAFSKRAREILNYATVITVRNEESLQYCKEFGINNDIQVTADTALVIKEFLDREKQDVPRFETENGKKMLLFHIDSNAEVTAKLKEIVVPATIRFLKAHPDYQLYLAADGIKRDSHYQEYETIFAGCDPITLKYDDPWKLTRQIERADLIITTKLHVGIVGSALGRSVVSFPFVPNKTLRFYKQIGEADRCVPLKEITTEKAYQMLEAYKDRMVTVPQELIDKAKLNLELLPKE
jgi:polysaccharide pyruvyl transferase WcaK-like protein